MIADGNYAVYGIGEDGYKEKIGSFSIEAGKVTKSNFSMVPEGKIDSRTQAHIERLINDDHGYTHVEKV